MNKNPTATSMGIRQKNRKLSKRQKNSMHYYTAEATEKAQGTVRDISIENLRLNTDKGTQTCRNTRKSQPEAQCHIIHKKIP